MTIYLARDEDRLSIREVAETASPSLRELLEYVGYLGKTRIVDSEFRDLLFEERNCWKDGSCNTVFNVYAILRRRGSMEYVPVCRISPDDPTLEEVFSEGLALHLESLGTYSSFSRDYFASRRIVGCSFISLIWNIFSIARVTARSFFLNSSGYLEVFPELSFSDFLHLGFFEDSQVGGLEYKNFSSYLECLSRILRGESSVFGLYSSACFSSSSGCSVLWNSRGFFEARNYCRRTRVYRVPYDPKGCPVEEIPHLIVSESW